MRGRNPSPSTWRTRATPRSTSNRASTDEVDAGSVTDAGERYDTDAPDGVSSMSPYPCVVTSM